MIALDDALNALAKVEPLESPDYRTTATGYVSEIKMVLRVSPDTVKRDWRLARAWLLAEFATHKTKGPKKEFFNPFHFRRSICSPECDSGMRNDARWLSLTET